MHSTQNNGSVCCHSAVQTFFLEADPRVSTNPCPVSQVDLLGTLGFIVCCFKMHKLRGPLKSHLATFFFLPPQDNMDLGDEDEDDEKV